MLRRRGRRRACRNRQTTQLDNPRDYLERNEVKKEERKGEGRKRRRGKFVVVRGCRLGDSAREGREVEEVRSKSQSKSGHGSGASSSTS